MLSVCTVQFCLCSFNARLSRSISLQSSVQLSYYVLVQAVAVSDYPGSQQGAYQHRVLSATHGSFFSLPVRLHLQQKDYFRIL